MKKKLSIFVFLGILALACNCYNINYPFGTTTPTNRTSTKTITFSDTATPVPGPPQTILTSAAPFNISWDDRSLFKKRVTTTYQDDLDQLAGASIYHLAFSFSDPPTSISGMEEVRYSNQENVSLTEVDFAIFPEILGGTIQVSHVLLDGQPVTPNFSNGLMRIPLAAALEPGRSVIIRVEFAITVPTRGGDFYYGIYGYNDGILSLAQAFPTILVYNEQGWNNQTPDLDGDPLFSDTSFFLVSIDAPADLVLVASGAEVSREVTGVRQRVLYADGPARDFYLAASTDFEKYSETAGETTFNSYAPANMAKYAKSALKTAEAAISDFSTRYAAYPYTEFNIVPIITSAGGVEFPGMTAVAENVYNEGDFLEVVVTHEVGHQWFYNLVGNDTQDQPWLDESLAEFVTWQYFLDRYGTQEAESYLEEMQGSWDMLDDQKIPIGKPVSAYTSDGYVAIVYGRGPFFFLALRDKIGQAVFDKLMLRYAATFSWDIAATDSFKSLAEEQCKCDLTALFNEWVTP
jgi:hypothetical protein